MNRATLVLSALLLCGAGQAKAGYVTLDPPGSTITLVYGVSGGNVVGSYYDSVGMSHGFLYDGSGFTTLDPPGSNYTVAQGVSGANVVGDYLDSAGFHGFLYHADVSAVPEPASVTLLGFGLVGLAGYGWRRRKRSVPA